MLFSIAIYLFQERSVNNPWFVSKSIYWCMRKALKMNTPKETAHEAAAPMLQPYTTTRERKKTCNLQRES